MQMVPQPFACHTHAISASNKAHWFAPREMGGNFSRWGGSACEVTVGISLRWCKGQIHESREEAVWGLSACQLVCVQLAGSLLGVVLLLVPVTYEALSPSNISARSFPLLLLSDVQYLAWSAIKILTSVCPLSQHTVISLSSVLTTKPICHNVIQTVSDSLS